MRTAALEAIEYHLPETVLSTAILAAEHPDWSVEKIDSKTGIHERHVAAPEERSSHLAAAAAKKLFTSGVCRPEEIDYLLFCTQTPDYLLPTTACLLQDRLGLPTTAGAIDINQGSSGYVYALGLAQGLIESGQATNLLLVTADTFTQLIHPGDRSVRTIFGDGATATLLKAVESPHPLLGPYIYGTDGARGSSLICPPGQNLQMDGAAIFAFTIEVVPPLVQQLLTKSGKTIEEIDLFVFHQANQQILEHLRKKSGIPKEKFVVALSQSGNTVSGTIPLALKEAWNQGKLKPGAQTMLVGFGGGASWAATLFQRHFR